MTAVSEQAVSRAARKPVPAGRDGPRRRDELRGRFRRRRRDGALPVRRGGAETQVPLRDYDAGVWHAFVPGIGAGQAYGYRATGPYDPAHGVRCNPAKLLLDPYARAFSGTVTFGPEVLGYSADDPDAPSTLDSSAHVPRSLVVDEAFSWRRRRTAQAPVRGHGHLRGARQGLHDASPGGAARTARHLCRARPRGGHRPSARSRRDRRRAAAGARKRARGVPGGAKGSPITGVTTRSGTSRRIRATRPRCGRGGPAARSLSSRPWSTPCTRAGLEVLLDVVFNHTAEADQLGPTLCYRGLDNPAYYRLEPGDRALLRRHDGLRQLAQRR